MSSPILAFPAKRANRAMLTSTMRLAFETTMERRRKRASQCAGGRCPARSRASHPCPCTAVQLAGARHRRRNRPHSTGVCASASAARSSTHRWPCHAPRIPRPPAGLKHDPKPSRPRAVQTFFQIMPHLVELDHHRPTLRLGFLRVGGRELLEPDLDRGCRDPEQLGGAVHRETARTYPDGTLIH